MRKPIIAGNWKMYKTPTESVAFIEALLPLIAGHKRDEILLFPPFTSLAATIVATIIATDDHHHVRAGAQNMHWLNEGPYTGEISPTMLVSLGCRHVLLGHSEQRLYFNETDERVNLKLRAAIAHGLTPIVCVGETLTEREDGRTEETICTQIRAALRNVKATEARRLVIAYEPVWAIGTGSTATPEIAAEAHRIVRKELANACGERTAKATRILYGGSVKPDNISALMAEDDIDGALIGGASLIPETFAKIIHYA